MIWHREMHLKHLLGAIKDPEIAAKLRALQEKRSGYLKHLVILLLLGVALFAGPAVKAQQSLLPSPIITTIAKDITDEEIFYVGGKVPATKSQVVIYLQSLHDGQTFSQTVEADNKGDWFYSYPNFLAPGRYLVWVQANLGNQASAPSPQFEISVSQTALQFGVSRISLEALYLVFVVILLLSTIGLVSFILYHGYHGRRKSLRLELEVQQAEQAIKKGFLVLHRDLQAELTALRKKKDTPGWSKEESDQEKKLLNDIEEIGKIIEKEVRDIERLIG